MRVADGLRRHRRGQGVADLVVAAPRGEHPGEGHAGLAVVHEPAADQVGDGLFEVGVVADDGRRLAAELEGAALELLAADGTDLAAGGGGAGEAHLVDVRVAHQVLAHLAVGGDDVDHAGGHAGVDEDLGQHVGVEGGLRRRLEDDGRSRGQGRAELQAGDEQRHVPGDDAGGHADGLAAHDDLAAESAVAALLEREGSGVHGEGVEDHRRREDLAEHREVERRADLFGDEAGEVVLAGLDAVGARGGSGRRAARRSRWPTRR